MLGRIGEEVITIVIPSADKSMMLERAARLRCMADALWYELKDLKEPLTSTQREACRRVGRWQSEADDLEKSAEEAQ